MNRIGFPWKDSSSIPEANAFTEDIERHEKAGTLPKRIKKEVLTAGQTSEARPSSGDDCMVHYVARLEDEAEEFSSSRAQGSPVMFSLGAGHVFRGWELAVATMVRGEVSKFACPPEYAYGKDGLPPDIPGDATLVMELQLVHWRPENDLFGDGGVIRTKIQDGSGSVEPEEDSEVLCSLKAVACDGRVLEERLNFEYVVGDRSLGPLARVVSRALEDMTKGAKVSLKCWPQYAYEDEVHGDVTLELTLVEVYQLADVSPGKDKSVVKKVIQEGVGHQTPLDGGTLHLAVESVMDASGVALPGHTEQKSLEITAGNGEVCDALEYAVSEMRQGERALIQCSKVDWCVDPKLGLEAKDVDSTREGLTFKVQLLKLDQREPSNETPLEEKLAFVAQRKEIGSTLFKAQRYYLALQRYEFAIAYLKCFGGLSDAGTELARTCELNRAACLLKLGDNVGARDCCTKILKSAPGNVKALYRRASAHLALKDHAAAATDLRALLKCDPENKEAQRLLQQAVRGKKQDEKTSDSTLADMNKAFHGFSEEEERRCKQAKEAQAEKEAREAEDNKELAEKWQKYLDERRRGVPRSVEDTAEEMKRVKEAAEEARNDSEIGFYTRKLLGGRDAV